MPPIRLQFFTHSPGLAFYLDTSAVLPLAFAETDEQMNEREELRCNKVKEFLERAGKIGSWAVCSVLVFEEIAAKVRAKVRNEAQRAILVREQESSWKDYERSHQAQADADLKSVHATMLTMLEHTINALRKVGARVEHPTGLPVVAGLPAVDIAKKLRKAHRGYLSSYPKIDSMDAMHLAFGGHLGCKHFISFDKAWIDITEIQLIN